MTQVRIASFYRDANGTLAVYDIFELDRGRYVARFFRAAMVRFYAGDTDLIEVGTAPDLCGWHGRVAASR